MLSNCFDDIEGCFCADEYRTSDYVEKKASPFESDTREFIASTLDMFFSKNDDYGRKQPLSNFYEAAERLNLSPLQVWGVYFDKHLQAIHSYTSNGKVESEPIEGRIQDCIGYLLLLRALIRDKNEDKIDASKVHSQCLSCGACDDLECCSVI